jgi:hypothetical protein
MAALRCCTGRKPSGKETKMKKIACGAIGAVALTLLAGCASYDGYGYSGGSYYGNAYYEPDYYSGPY